MAMSDPHLDYWRECISCAADECGLSLTDEQLECLAAGAKGGHECYGDAFYQPDSPYPGEIRRLQDELKREQSKVVCPKCAGAGTYTTYGPYHSATGRCFKCQGDGKVLP